MKPFPPIQSIYLLLQRTQPPDSKKWDNVARYIAINQAREKFPRRKIPTETDWKTIQKKYPEIYSSIRERVHRVFDKLCDKYKQKKDRLEKIFARLAKNALIPSGEEIVVFETSSYDYWSQGFGATKYARGATQKEEALFNLTGVETRLEESEVSYINSGGHSMAHRSYKLFAKTTPMGAKMVKIKAAPFSLVEQVKTICKNHLNPRVYYPFLPYDFEERHGIK